MWDARTEGPGAGGLSDGPALDPEARLVAQARAPAALRRALARVAGRLVETRGWERLGFARLCDYADERAGVSARELRDLAAVDRALGERRGLEAAFLAGRIGWTQLRLLCRVAQPEDQGRWLALACALTTRELAREVRAVDRRAREPLAVEDHADDARVGVVLRLSRRARARWWAARSLAQKVAGHALTHAEFAELLAAEVLSGIPVDTDAQAPSEAPDERPARGDRAAPRPPRRGLPPVRPPPAGGEVAALTRDLEGADAFALDARLRRGLALEARWLARLAALLAEFVGGGGPRELGYRGLDAYAEERLGLSRSRARALLRIERAARVCPPLRAAFAAGRISWVQAQALLPLLLEPAAARYREAWIARAESVSVRRLRDEVERALALGALAPPPLEAGPAAAEETDPSGVQTGASAGLPVEEARLFFAATPEVAGLFRAVLAAVQRRLERARGRPACRSEALEAMLAHAVAAWQPENPHPREYAVFARDGWRCTAPGCTAYKNLQRHHVVFRSRGGGEDESNLTTLCVWHHLRGVHGGTLRCTGTAPGGLRFAFGLRPGTPPLAVYTSEEVRMDLL